MVNVIKRFAKVDLQNSRGGVILAAELAAHVVTY